MQRIADHSEPLRKRPRHVQPLLSNRLCGKALDRALFFGLRSGLVAYTSENFPTLCLDGSRQRYKQSRESLAASSCSDGMVHRVCSQRTDGTERK
eukprot:4169451-Amphidinium_carterae.1